MSSVTKKLKLTAGKISTWKAVSAEMAGFCKMRQASEQSREPQRARV